MAHELVIQAQEPLGTAWQFASCWLTLLTHFCTSRVEYASLAWMKASIGVQGSILLQLKKSCLVRLAAPDVFDMWVVKTDACVEDAHFHQLPPEALVPEHFGLEHRRHACAICLEAAGGAPMLGVIIVVQPLRRFGGEPGKRVGSLLFSKPNRLSSCKACRRLKHQAAHDLESVDLCTIYKELHQPAIMSLTGEADQLQNSGSDCTVHCCPSEQKET